MDKAIERPKYLLVSVPLRGNGYKEPQRKSVLRDAFQNVSVPLRGNGYKELYLHERRKKLVARFRPLAGKWV